MYEFGSIDWSGTPDAPLNDGSLQLYLPCGIRFPSLDMVDEQCALWRTEFGLAGHELHGYKLRRRPEVFVRVIEFVLKYAQVTAFLFDKLELRKELGCQVFDKPGQLVPASGLLVCHRMLESGPLRQLWLDEDIAPSRRPGFNTEIKRNARSLWPDHGIAHNFPKHHPSDKHNIIQLADMIAYVLQREAHGLSETAQLSHLIKALWRMEENYIKMGCGDDLQPYL